MGYGLTVKASMPSADGKDEDDVIIIETREQKPIVDLFPTKVDAKCIDKIGCKVVNSFIDEKTTLQCSPNDTSTN